MVHQVHAQVFYLKKVKFTFSPKALPENLEQFYQKLETTQASLGGWRREPQRTRALERYWVMRMSAHRHPQQREWVSSAIG